MHAQYQTLISSRTLSNRHAYPSDRYFSLPLLSIILSFFHDDDDEKPTSIDMSTMIWNGFLGICCSLSFSLLFLSSNLMDLSMFVSRWLCWRWTGNCRSFKEKSLFILRERTRPSCVCSSHCRLGEGLLPLSYWYNFVSYPLVYLPYRRGARKEVRVESGDTGVALFGFDEIK